MTMKGLTADERRMEAGPIWGDRTREESDGPGPNAKRLCGHR